MSAWSGNYFGWAPRKSAAARRADAARQIKAAARGGKPMTPVVVVGRKIATTFWGKAWCDNLERYRDFAYRLERGRSYVRSGAVIDLRLEAGKITALVSGSSIYTISIEIDAVASDAWRAIRRDCTGNIGSRVDLLSGRLTDPVMARLCADRTGLFPAPTAIRFTCSCPDHALMCKHVAAVMYGIGARLDHTPELLFTLRRVSADELIASALAELPAAPSSSRVLAVDGLAELFGIELAEGPAKTTRARAKAPRPSAKAPRELAAKEPPKPTRQARAAPVVKARAPAKTPTRAPSPRAKTRRATSQARR
jgi:uncharacterized Zn finger protein